MMSFCVSIFHPRWVQCQVCGFQRGVWSTNLRHDGQTLHSSRQALIATLEEMSERAIARNPNKEVVPLFPGERCWKHCYQLLLDEKLLEVSFQTRIHFYSLLVCVEHTFLQSTLRGWLEQSRSISHSKQFFTEFGTQARKLWHSKDCQCVKRKRNKLFGLEVGRDYIPFVGMATRSTSEVKLACAREMGACF